MATLIYDALSGLQISTPEPSPAYVHVQSMPEAVWTVAHGLGFQPTVSLVDTAGTEFAGDIEHLSAVDLRITLSTPLAGMARCV